MGKAAGRAQVMRAFGIFGLVALSLTACMTPAAQGRASLLGGAVQVGAPEGYCPEPQSRMERGDSAILLIGRCAGSAAQAPAVLTVAVGAAGSGAGLDLAAGGAELADFFRSDAGRQALSRRGRAADVTVLEARRSGAAFLMRLRDRGPQGRAPVQAESWRAVLPLGGRMVTLTVTGPADAPLDRDTGLALLQAFVAATLAANRS